MKIAVISDIHGNASALLKVIEEIKKLGVKNIYCLGDVVGYYPEAQKVVEILISNNVFSIMGNHDFALVNNRILESKVANDALKWTKQNLSAKAVKYLASLPLKINLNIGGYRILFVHGSPWDYLNERVYIDSDLERFCNLPYDIVIMGHTHRPFILSKNGKIILNPGSVGESRDGDKRSAFLILDFSKEKIQIELVRSSYNANNLIKKIKKFNFPENLIDYLP